MTQLIPPALTIHQRSTPGEPTPLPVPRAASPTLGTGGLIVLLIGVFLPMLDFFITNVALPTIDRDLHASAASLELIVAGYGIAYTLFLVFGGRLGDAFGRKNLFIAGLLGFTVASLLCGLAPNTASLIAFRILQGAAAAMINPQTLATFQAALTGPARARAVSLYAATGGIAVVVGQLLGGVLLQADIAGTGWRPIFLVNVPIGLIAIALAPKLVPDTRSPHPAHLDLPGTALLGVAIISLLIPLTEGRASGWPWWMFLLLALAPVTAVAMYRVERHTERRGRLPLLSPMLLATPGMRRGLPVAVPFFMGFGTFMFIFALTVQDGLHDDALQSGLAITPMAVAYFVGALLVPRLVGRYGRTVLTVGMGVQAAGLVVLLATMAVAWPHVGILAFAPGLVIAGFGQALALGALFRLVLGSVPPSLAGVGSGVLVTVQQGSLALGVASLGTLFQVRAEHGILGAFLLVAGIQAVAAAILSVAGRRLPNPA